MRDGPDDWVIEAIATRDLERVPPNMGAAGERMNDARRHVSSARLLAERDPTLAMSACHDAIRKAVTAHMSAGGLRPRNGDGAHRIVLDYAGHLLRSAIEPGDLADASDIRRDRATAEYGDFAAMQLRSDHVRAAADVAARIVAAISTVLADDHRS